MPTMFSGWQKTNTLKNKKNLKIVIMEGSFLKNLTAKVPAVEKGFKKKPCYG